MLEKFIELLDHKSELVRLKHILNECGICGICEFDTVQLLKTSQQLFDEFCKHTKQNAIIVGYKCGGKDCTKKVVSYKNLIVYIYDDGDVE